MLEVRVPDCAESFSRPSIHGGNARILAATGVPVCALVRMEANSVIPMRPAPCDVVDPVIQR